MIAKRLAEINQKASELASQIKVLSSLSWPVETEILFLENLEKGKIVLPRVEYQPIDYTAVVNELEKLLKSFTAADPLEIFTQRMIASYVDAAELVQCRGEERFTERSIAIFGRPGDKIPGSHTTTVEAAQRLIDLANQFQHPYVEEPEVCLSAEFVRRDLQERIRARMGSEGPEVVITDKQSAKASANSKLVKLRPGTCYSSYDPDQLFHHEVMVHALTALNGQKQPILKILGRGAPRTTATQEGLATFAELITGAIDLTRLKRLALRIIAIDMALNGASFFDCFQYFQEQGQDDKESFWSAARIFRGGYPDKQIVFTKDGVYMDGLIKVHTLFRWALIHERIGLTHLLFCGRVAIDDLFLLESALATGDVAMPKYVPEWYEKIAGLAGQLTFSYLTNAINLHEIEDYFERGCR